MKVTGITVHISRMSLFTDLFVRVTGLGVLNFEFLTFKVQLLRYSLDGPHQNMFFLVL